MTGKIIAGAVGALTLAGALVTGTYQVAEWKSEREAKDAAHDAHEPHLQQLREYVDSAQKRQRAEEMKLEAQDEVYRELCAQGELPPAYCRSKGFRTP